MPSRRLATPCRGGNLNLPLQVTSLLLPSLSSLPEPLHRRPTMPCHACSNQFSPCNVVPVCYSRPTMFMFQPPSTMFSVPSYLFLACLPVSLSHSYLHAEYGPPLLQPHCGLSGRMLAYHAGGPGSFPGRHDDAVFHLDHFSFLNLPVSLPPPDPSSLCHVLPGIYHMVKRLPDPRSTPINPYSTNSDSHLPFNG